MSKKVIFLVALLLFLSVFFIILASLKDSGEKTQPVTQEEPILPTPIPISTSEFPDETYNQSFEKVIPEIIQNATLKEDSLLRKMPYLGEDFMIDYNYGELSFVAEIDKEKEEQGRLELDQFLKTNGIQSSSEITIEVVVR